MPEAFINKIKLIILEHLEDEKFGVNELSLKLGLSRSQILRKVKNSIGKSANLFIREIRLEEAVKLLKKSELTASEIAYRVGFSSPSYFNKCFHDHYGFTPGDYKKQPENSIQINPNQALLNPSPILLKRKIVWSIVPIIALVIAYFVFEKVVGNKNNLQEQQTSIAVLPLLDLSENKNKDYLCVGITDAITLELSKLNGLRVISRGSTMLFKEPSKLYSEIANQLGVDLLLEGSVIYDSDSLRVIVQLIKPFPVEKHLWANKYDKNSSNIFNLADEISIQIAKEINMVVSPKNKLIEKKTLNPAAYELYLRGKHLWYQQNPTAVKKAIELLKESIEIDSSYAPSYSALAEAYISMNKFIRNNDDKLQNRKDSRDAINTALKKAVELDGSLGDAYIAMGNILGKFDWDWEGMKKMAEKGLAMAPNNSDGHILLAKYFTLTGDLGKAKNEALFAERLDPLNKRTACFVAELYFIANQYDESVKQYKKVLEIDPHYGLAWDGLGYVQYISGKKEEAMKSWQKLHVIMGNHQMAEYFGANEIINALNHWLDLATKGEGLLCSNPSIIAQAYMFVENNEGSLKFLEHAFELKNEDLPIMLLRPHFSPLHNEPRFKELVKKVGIPAIN